MRRVNKNIKTGLLGVLVVFQTACSFNKVFLRPDEWHSGTSQVIINTPNDTMMVYFSGSNHQPAFTKKNGKDTINLNFTIEGVSIKSADGDSLNGWFLKPKNQTAKVTLLHFHGNGGHLLNQYKAISPLVKNGFQIFLFDYSGFGFSTGKATRKNALTDALSVFDYLKMRSDVKGTKLVIYGQSFGGHLSAVVAEKRQKEIDGLVMEGAFSSPKDMAASRAGVLGRVLVKTMYSAKKSIRNFHKPVLVIHSVEDQVVPFYMAKKILDRANSPKEFYEIKNCHICGPHYYPDEISERIYKMLK
jgi:fermentation-respiration switch protein FrsA (DUF1100 family)